MLDFSRVHEADVNEFARPGRYGPISERLIQGLYEDILSTGDAAADVGVNYGVHLFQMRKCVGDSGLVIGIEASLERYAGLLKRIARQSLTNVSVLNIAAADSEGFCDFFVNKSHSGWSSRLDGHQRTPEDIVEKVRVYAAPLSIVIPVSINLSFIKLDIEGGEFPALLGARELIRRSSPIVVFEGRLTKTAAQFGHSAEAIAQLFDDLDYEIYDLFGRRINPLNWNPGAAWNYVAFKKEPSLAEKVGSALTGAWIKIFEEARP